MKCIKIKMVLLIIFCAFIVGINNVSAASAGNQDDYENKRAAAIKECRESAENTVEKKYKDSDKEYKDLAIEILYEECMNNWEKKNPEPKAGTGNGENGPEIGEKGLKICTEVVDNIPNLTSVRKEELMNECKLSIFQKKLFEREDYLKTICGNVYSELRNSSVCAEVVRGSTIPASDACVGMDAIIFYGIYVVKVLHIAAPILLILWASIDLLKSIMSNDEKKIQDSRKPIIQRFITAALIFIIPWIINTIVLSLTGRDTRSADWSRCWRKAWSNRKEDSDIFDIKKWEDN